MTTGGKTSPADLESSVEAFERARAQSAHASIGEFVPDLDDPEYIDIVVELARVDLEFSLRERKPRDLSAYQAAFPGVFVRPDAIERLAFEEYRLTWNGGAGEGRTPAEYSEEYGIDTSDWPRWSEWSDDGGIGSAAPQADQTATDRNTSSTFSSWRPQGSPDSFPEIGSRHGDFEIISELGRGAFARVYCARQGALALRHVALKITVDPNLEPQRLAELQHTNIVPIHSVHHEGNLQAVCMPYLGSTTLRDILSSVRQHQAIPSSAREVLEKLLAEPNDPAVPPRTMDEETASAAEGSVPTLAQLSSMSYENAMVWITVQIASGLVHAHRRGVIHRDLKPANILISNDGVPLILDFNLSTGATGRGADRAVVGGTLPYMAPEQIDSLRTGGSVGPQSDIYSLGVVLYELLTGQLPFPVRNGPVDSTIDQMREDRKHPAPSAQQVNPHVSPDIAAVVARCLEADTARRYRSAHQLQTDLDLHLHDLPPRFARGRSLRERARKWVRRHPRLASASTVGFAAAVFLLLLAAVLIRRDHTVKVHEAEEKARELHHAVSTSSARLSAGQLALGLGPLSTAIDEGRALLRQHGAWTTGHWREGPPFTLLNQTEQQSYSQDITELQFLMSAGQLRAAKHVKDDEQKRELLAEAEHLSQLAQAGIPSGSQAMSELQSRIAVARGADGIDDVPRSAPNTTGDGDRSPFGQYLRLLSFPRGTADQALADSLCKQMDQNPMVWLIRANLHFEQRQLDDAEFCYTKCISLEPRSFAAHWLRGIARFGSGNIEGADSDFEKATKLRGKWAQASFNLGVVRQAQGRLAEALDEMTTALDQGAVENRIYLTRSALRREMGDLDGANKDRQVGLELTPADAPNWIARGVAHYSRSPDLAEADFRHAIELNPRSATAWTNLASVLAERLGRTAEAIEAMNHVVELTPSSASSVATRGVLYARLGRRDEAIRDASNALEMDDGYETKYLVAGIYAQTARSHRPDVQMALRFLKAAVWEKPDFVAGLLPLDADLRPLHELPAFNDLLQTLAELRPPLRTL